MTITTIGGPVYKSSQAIGIESVSLEMTFRKETVPVLIYADGCSTIVHCISYN